MLYLTATVYEEELIPVLIYEKPTFYGALILGIISIHLIVKHFLPMKKWVFTYDELTIKNWFGSTQVLKKRNVTRIFILKIDFQERITNSVQDYAIEVCFKLEGNNGQENQYPLFRMDDRFTFSSLLGITRKELSHQTYAETKAICDVISDFWKIPVKV